RVREVRVLLDRDRERVVAIAARRDIAAVRVLSEDVVLEVAFLEIVAGRAAPDLDAVAAAELLGFDLLPIRHAEGLVLDEDLRDFFLAAVLDVERNGRPNFLFVGRIVREVARRRTTAAAAATAATAATATTAAA